MRDNCLHCFESAGVAEITSDLYLVANVMRVGKMIHSESAKKGDKLNHIQNYRRPYGVGVLSLSTLAMGTTASDNGIEPEEKEHSFKVDVSYSFLNLQIIIITVVFAFINLFFNPF